MRTLLKYLLITAAFSAVQALDVLDHQAQLVVGYYASQLGLEAEDIELNILHAPDIDSNLLRKGMISVQSSKQNLNLGHQTLWLVQKSGSRVKKRWPITVEVFAKLELPVARINIRRLDPITSSNIDIKSIRVGREYRRLLTADTKIMGMMASQSIRAGRPLEKNMIKFAPDVLRGAELQIILNTNGISLALPGVAKEEALIGEELRVQCPTTRKEFTGILQNQQEVLVSLR